MKKLILAVFAILVVSTLSTTAYAADQVWKQTYLLEGSILTYFTTTEQGISCSVSENHDGTIETYARDSSWYGKEVLNFGHISKDGMLESYNRVSSFENTNTLSISNSNDGGYWVFATKCAEAAKQLPAEVRAKFHDVYGISN